VDDSAITLARSKKLKEKERTKRTQRKEKEKKLKRERNMGKKWKLDEVAKKSPQQQ
jgi:hypothetical protein